MGTQTAVSGELDLARDDPPATTGVNFPQFAADQLCLPPAQRQAVLADEVNDEPDPGRGFAEVRDDRDFRRTARLEIGVL